MTPPPFTPVVPMVAWGGGSVAAARRAGRHGLDFLANGSIRRSEPAYREEAVAQGHEPGMWLLPEDDHDDGVVRRRGRRRWPGRSGPYLMHDVTMYVALNEGAPTAPRSPRPPRSTNCGAEEAGPASSTVDEAVDLGPVGHPAPTAPTDRQGRPRRRRGGTCVRDRPGGPGRDPGVRTGTPHAGPCPWVRARKRNHLPGTAAEFRYLVYRVLSRKNAYRTRRRASRGTSTAGAGSGPSTVGSGGREARQGEFELLQFVIAGLVTGGIYAIAAAGLVITYTSSGIFNFAFGAMAFFIARFYYFLHTQTAGPSGRPGWWRSWSPRRPWGSSSTRCSSGSSACRHP